MLGRQNQSKSIGGITRDKTSRAFGQDLTHCYNNQSSFTKEQVQISCFSFLPSQKSKFIVESPTDKVSNSTQGSIYDMESVAKQINNDPLDDHLEDIISYTLSQSHISFISEDYMRWHSQINQEMREVLISWLMRLQVQFKLQHSTLCLAVHLIDKYCYQQSIMKNKYQLLGITCLFMAAKYEQLLTPRVHRFVDACEGLYLRKDIVQMEHQVLECVGFNINQLVLLRQLLLNRVDQTFRNICSCGDMDEENEHQNYQRQAVLQRCQYIIQLTLIQYKLNLLPPHYISAIILYMCCKIEGIQTINSKFVMEKYSLDEKMFKTYFQSLISLVKRKSEHKFRDVNKKYYYLSNTDF